MRPKHSSTKKPAEQVVKAIRRATRRHFSAEGRIRSVLEGLRGDDSIARSIASALEQHSRFETELSLRNELRILSLHVPDTMEPVTIGDLKLPGSSRVIARIRESSETFADGDAELRAGDAIMIVVEHEDQETVQKLFNSKGDV